MLPSEALKSMKVMFATPCCISAVSMHYVTSIFDLTHFQWRKSEAPDYAASGELAQASLPQTFSVTRRQQRDGKRGTFPLVRKAFPLAQAGPGIGRLPCSIECLDSRELQVIAPGKTNSDRSGGRGFFIAIFAALTAAPAAFAGDMPAPAPVYTKAPVPVANDWTGFYLGAGVGFRSANASAPARDGYLVTADLLVYGTGDAARQHMEATSTVVGPFDEIRLLYQFRHRHQNEVWHHDRRRYRIHGLGPLARARRVPPL
jgi:hypothetical protein